MPSLTEDKSFFIQSTHLAIDRLNVIEIKTSFELENIFSSYFNLLQSIELFSCADSQTAAQFWDKLTPAFMDGILNRSYLIQLPLGQQINSLHSLYAKYQNHCAAFVRFPRISAVFNQYLLSPLETKIKQLKSEDIGYLTAEVSQFNKLIINIFNRLNDPKQPQQLNILAKLIASLCQGLNFSLQHLQNKNLVQLRQLIFDKIKVGEHLEILYDYFLQCDDLHESEILTQLKALLDVCPQNDSCSFFSLGNPGLFFKRPPKPQSYPSYDIWQGKTLLNISLAKPSL